MIDNKFSPIYYYNLGIQLMLDEWKLGQLSESITHQLL